MATGILFSSQFEPVVGPGRPGLRTSDSLGPSSAIESPSSFTIGAEGLRPDQIKAWTKAFIGYENYATNHKVAERALRFVVQHKKNYDEKTYALQRKWQLHWALYQGRSLLGYSGSDITATHVPEYWKMVETMCPRLEEPFLAFDPPFDVKGRDRMDRRRARKIRGLLQWQMAENNAEQLLADLDRLALMYGFAVVKSWWVYDTAKRIKRNVKKKFRDGRVVYESRPEEVEEIVYEGPRLRAIENPWFIIDTESADPQTVRFVGDGCLMTYDEILDYERQGWFEGAAALRDQHPVHSRTFADFTRQTRSLTLPWDASGVNRDPEGTPRQFVVNEIWGMFDLFNTGRARECVITVANDNVVLRVQENPFDDKHRPYAVWKTCPHPLEFHTMGPLDHLIPLSMEYDRMRRVMSKAVELQGCPVILANEQADLPENLWGVRPGEILNCDPKAVQSLEIKADITGLRYYGQVLRQDHEEAAGAPRIFEGGDGGNTATEAERRLQEGNKRMRALVRGKARMMTQILQHMHALNRQFMREAVLYRVLGREALDLGEYQEIGPDEIDSAVDFEFVGLRTQKSQGLEGPAIATLFQLLTPMIQANPQIVQNVDWLRLAQFALDATVGIMPGEEIIRVPEPIEKMMTQDMENLILAQGEEVEVHPGDNDDEHIRVISRHMESQEFDQYQEPVKTGFLKHLFQHEMQKQNKKARSGAAENMAPSTPYSGQMGLPGQGSINQPEGASAAPVGPAIPSQSPQAETPGPPNEARMRKPGRKMTPSQGEGLMFR